MGHTISEWRTRVQALLRDAGAQDWSTGDNGQIDEVGIKPALAQYSVDRPYELAVEQPGAGSAYFDMPAGWLDGFSALTAVEYPARQNPPSLLDEQSFQIVRKPADVSIKQVLLAATPTAAEHVRFYFTAAWPTPTATPTIDKVDDVAYHAVTSLAASLCLVHLAAEAARDRSAALPSNFVAGKERSQALQRESERYRAVYNSFLGIAAGAGSTGSSGSAAASRRFDFDPGRASLFHGGRR